MFRRARFRGSRHERRAANTEFIRLRRVSNGTWINQELSFERALAGRSNQFHTMAVTKPRRSGNKLGMDLELESTETAAGDFSADIIARDLSTNDLVVIENQFGNTDHRHLGQIITYSSFLGAEIVVWIAENIRSEHKKAVDFLNQNLKESLKIYALEASVIRIDESRPAFVLNLVCQPTEQTIITPEHPCRKLARSIESLFPGANRRAS